MGARPLWLPLLKQRHLFTYCVLASAVRTELVRVCVCITAYKHSPFALRALAHPLSVIKFIEPFTCLLHLLTVMAHGLALI